MGNLVCLKKCYQFDREFFQVELPIFKVTVSFILDGDFVHSYDELYSIDDEVAVDVVFLELELENGKTFASEDIEEIDSLRLEFNDYLISGAPFVERVDEQTQSEWLDIDYREVQSWFLSKKDKIEKILKEE